MKHSKVFNDIIEYLSELNFSTKASSSGLQLMTFEELLESELTTECGKDIPPHEIKHVTNQWKRSLEALLEAKNATNELSDKYKIDSLRI
ncbi:hypothetical protein [Vibrio harveyi]|uniref:hypothetical protein n=1 Tax=Vibrio harveyi TaxID=669 RepID=UPI000648EFE0|nr:hypothetical protein [Vibrio harveyi]